MISLQALESHYQVPLKPSLLQELLIFDQTVLQQMLPQCLVLSSPSDPHPQLLTGLLPRLQQHSHLRVCVNFPSCLCKFNGITAPCKSRPPIPSSTPAGKDTFAPQYSVDTTGPQQSPFLEKDPVVTQSCTTVPLGTQRSVSTEDASTPAQDGEHFLSSTSSLWVTEPRSHPQPAKYYQCLHERVARSDAWPWQPPCCPGSSHWVSSKPRKSLSLISRWMFPFLVLNPCYPLLPTKHWHWLQVVDQAQLAQTLLLPELTPLPFSEH